MVNIYSFAGKKDTFRGIIRIAKKSSKEKYKNVPKGKFCGPAGGAAKGSYPVNTKKRCSAALSYARFAPKPCGIARCVRRKCPKSVGKSSALMKKCTRDRKTRFGELQDKRDKQFDELQDDMNDIMEMIRSQSSVNSQAFARLMERLELVEDRLSNQAAAHFY